MAAKRTLPKSKSDNVFGQPRKQPKMFRAGLYARVSTNVSFRYACVEQRFGCERQRSGSLSHVFREQGIHIIADPVTEVVADGAYFVESGDQGMTGACR